MCFFTANPLYHHRGLPGLQTTGRRLEDFSDDFRSGCPAPALNLYILRERQVPEAVLSVIDKITCDYGGLLRQVVYLLSIHMARLV